MKQISVQEFKKILELEKNNADIGFIDVRSEKEHRENRIEGVRNIPLEQITNHLSEFENKKTIYVHCLSGGRSQLAVEMLGSRKIKPELINVDGGLLAWHQAGFPIIS